MSRTSKFNGDGSSRGEAYKEGRRVFLAGASGVIGQRLIPQLVQAGYVVGGMTRSPSKMTLLRLLGAEPILCDAFDQEALIQAVRDFKPDVILNELTDLPDDVAKIGEHADLNARIRTEGNQNLIEAARRNGSPKILAQSVAWKLPDGPDARAVAELERSVLAEGGVVLRYGDWRLETGDWRLVGWKFGMKHERAVGCSSQDALRCRVAAKSVEPRRAALRRVSRNHIFGDRILTPYGDGA